MTKVEQGIDTLEFGEGTSSSYYFTVDIDPDEEINVMDFDFHVKTLLSRSPGDTLKFIAAQVQLSNRDRKPHSKMYVFSSQNSHADFFNTIQDTAGSQTLVSAGFLTVQADSGFGFLTRRSLIGNSDTVQTIFGLTKEDSDSYRKEVLVPRLGKYFTASE